MTTPQAAMYGDVYLRGFYLSFLLSAVDHCFTSPCRYNRTCTSFFDHYECDCGPDFRGNNCEEGLPDPVCFHNFQRKFSVKQAIISQARATASPKVSLGAKANCNAIRQNLIKTKIAQENCYLLYTKGAWLRHLPRLCFMTDVHEVYFHIKCRNYNEDMPKM